MITLEDWTDIMYTAMELNELAWIYFASFVILATFIVINLFTALIVNNLDTMNRARPREEEKETRATMLRELRVARDSLQRLEEQVERMSAERNRDG